MKKYICVYPIIYNLLALYGVPNCVRKETILLLEHFVIKIKHV